MPSNIPQNMPINMNSNIPSNMPPPPTVGMGYSRQPQIGKQAW